MLLVRNECSGGSEEELEEEYQKVKEVEKKVDEEQGVEGGGYCTSHSEILFLSTGGAGIPQTA